MGLDAIVNYPFLLTVGGLLFSTYQHNTDQFNALDQQQAAILQAYIDNIQELLLNHNLLKSKPYDDVAILARARTLIALQGLNPERKGTLVKFIYDTGLIGFDSAENYVVPNYALPQTLAVGAHYAHDPIIILAEADLSGAILSDAGLYGADLHEVNLTNADLSGDFLIGANLNAADLSRANLSSTDFTGVDFSGANLSGANLGGANLSYAKFDIADLNGADLYKAILDYTKLSVTINLTQQQLDQVLLIQRHILTLRVSMSLNYMSI